MTAGGIEAESAANGLVANIEPLLAAILRARVGPAAQKTAMPL